MVINYKINHVKSNSMPQSISYLRISAQYGNVNHVNASRPGRMLLVSFTAASKSAKRKCSRKSSVRLSHTGSHELGMNETSQTVRPLWIVDWTFIEYATSVWVTYPTKPDKHHLPIELIYSAAFCLASKVRCGISFPSNFGRCAK